MNLASISDYRAAAKARMPKVLFDYIDGGSLAETTLAANVADLQAVKLRQRVLTEVGEVSLATRLFGQDLSMPVILAPVGMAGMFAARGEAQAARAAKREGVPFTLSTVGVCGVAEVAKAAAPPWFQLYMLKDRDFMADVLARANEAQCPVLFFTVDLPIGGIRWKDIRNSLRATTARERFNQAIDGLAHPGWLWDLYGRGRPHNLGNIAGVSNLGSFVDYWNWIGGNFDPSIGWKDIEWVRQRWKGPLVLKGVIDLEDARRAADVGVEGIVVSNHGGRQLDGALSSAAALPAIAQAVGDRLTVLMDGGVRSGTDVLRALALGAKACLIGRAWAFAVGARGEAGVAAMLAMMRRELRLTMALTGCTDVKGAGRNLLV